MDINNLRLVCSNCKPETMDKPFGIGDNVKVILDSERMWFIVKSIDKDKGTFVGELNNDPVVITYLKYEDEIELKLVDIIDVLQSIPNEVKELCNKYYDKQVESGLSGSDCEAFYLEANKLGFTFDYDLSCEPSNFRKHGSN